MEQTIANSLLSKVGSKVGDFLRWGKKLNFLKEIVGHLS